MPPSSFPYPAWDAPSFLPSSVKIVLVFWSREKRKRKEISHILPAAEEEETERWKGRQKKTCFGAEKKEKERKSFSLLAPSHDSPVEERVRHPDYFLKNYLFRNIFLG